MHESPKVDQHAASFPTYKDNCWRDGGYIHISNLKLGRCWRHSSSILATCHPYQLHCSFNDVTKLPLRTNYSFIRLKSKK